MPTDCGDRQPDRSRIGHPTRRGVAWHPAVALLAAVAGGIGTDRFFKVAPAMCLLVVLGGLVLWWWFDRAGFKGRAIVSLFVVVAATAAARHHAHWHWYRTDELGRMAGRRAEPAAVELVISSLPYRVSASDDAPVWAKEDVWACSAVAERCRDGLAWRNCSGTIRLTIAAERVDLLPGDRYRVFGALSRIAEPMNPGQFDRAAHARADRCLCRLHVDSPAGLIPLVKRSHWTDHGAQRLLARFRRFCRAQLGEGVGPDRLPLAEALLLGRREELDDQLRDAFLTTGTVHLLCVSGLHVGLLAAALGAFLVRAMPSRRAAGGMLAAAIGAYVLLVGAQPPVLRAAVMVWTVLIAAAWGRRPWSLNTWAVAALIVLAINPADLFRTGPQLSFLCAACLLTVAATTGGAAVGSATAGGWSTFRSILARFAEKLRDTSRANTLLWLLSGPLVLARFHVATFLPIALNIVLIPPVALALCFGAATMVLGGIPWIGAGLGAVTATVLAVIEATVQLAARLPGGHWRLPGPADWWLAGFYAGAILIWLLPTRLPWRRRWAALAIWTLIGLGASWWNKPRDELRCTFIAVGHGCSVLIESPDGRVMLYDAGGMAEPRWVARQIAGVLWHRGVAHLDAVVFSHADRDHFNALPELLRAFGVGIVYASPAMFTEDRIAWHDELDEGEQTESALRSLMAALRAYKVPMCAIAAGDRLLLSADTRATAEVLHPPRRLVLGDDNANSLVLEVAFAGRKILLTGDLDKGGLFDLLAEEPRRCDVMLAPHHGSRTARLEELSAWASPRWIVVSDSPRHAADAVAALAKKTSESSRAIAVGPITPSEQAAGLELAAEEKARGQTILHTGCCGAIEVRVRAEGVCVQPWIAASPP